MLTAENNSEFFMWKDKKENMFRSYPVGPYEDESYADNIFNEIDDMGALSRADKGQIAFLVTCFGIMGFYCTSLLFKVY